MNGHIEKADGNFLGELFCTKIGDTRCCIGSYLSQDEDFLRLKKAGITGILCLMNSNDLRSRGLKQRQLDQLSKMHGLKTVKFPVSDIREKDLVANLFTAAQHLNSMLNNLNLNVYVHCNSGYTRSPAVVMAYLALFKQHRVWDSTEHLFKVMKSHNSKFRPNLRAV